MTVDIVVIVLPAALVCAWAAWTVARALRIARHLRGARVVTYPETGRPAEAAAPASTPRAIVESALKGESCAFCRKPIEDVAFLGHYPALLQSDRTTIAWPDVPLERLRDSLRSQRPVCWNCHVTETFRRRYPELVTDRPWTRA